MKLMNNHNYKSILQFCFFICLLSMNLPIPVRAEMVIESDSRPLSAKLDTYLEQAASFGFSGAVLIAINGKIVLQNGYGKADRARQVPIKSDTVFDIGSITKQFTSAAILKLEIQGKLKTGDPINKYLEGVPEDKMQVTIHHLLSHTSGFPEYSGGDYEKSERDETVKRILNTPLDFKPGSGDLYSNAGYSVLAAVKVHKKEQFCVKSSSPKI